MSGNTNVLFFLCMAVTFMGAVPPGKYRVEQVHHGARLQGSVTFKGAVPAPKVILISKDNNTCGTGNRQIQWVDLGDRRGLRNVAVYIASMDHGKAWNINPDGYLLDQKSCHFTPNFLAIPKGEKLRILNSDPMMHNIHMYEIVGRIRKTLFNKGQPERGTEFIKAINTRRGNTIKVECDAHNFMHAWIFVPENPYFDLVDAVGRFEMDSIPAGNYQVKAWHPTLGEQTAEVTLRADQELTLNFEFGTSE